MEKRRELKTYRERLKFSVKYPWWYGTKSFPVGNKPGESNTACTEKANIIQACISFSKFSYKMFLLKIVLQFVNGIIFNFLLQNKVLDQIVFCSFMQDCLKSLSSHYKTECWTRSLYSQVCIQVLHQILFTVT